MVPRLQAKGQLVQSCFKHGLYWMDKHWWCHLRFADTVPRTVRERLENVFVI